MRKLAPVKASGFVTLPAEVQQLLIENGAVPVNDVFFDLWESDAKILLLYGGYGSGKSIFLADYLINECREHKYFKCLFGRKVFEDVRKSVFSSIVKQIRRRKLEQEFDFSDKPNSSMIITHKATGNVFIPFGGSTIDNLKSIDEVTHIYPEELDQFSSSDFGLLYSRLRTEADKTQLVAAFNSATVTENHWLYQTFFKESTIAYTNEQNVVVTVTASIIKRFCNYSDNHFINRKAYEETLWISAGYNETKFREISRGEWGTEVKTNSFIYRFREKELKDMPAGQQKYSHLVDSMQPDYKLPLIVSFDFNVDPITALAGQINNVSNWVKILQEYRILNSDIFELCEHIRTDHAGAFFTITGDASGRNRTAITRGNRNYFQIIQAELNINVRQFVLPGVNPSISNSRAQCNTILAKHPDYHINRSCHYLVEDIRGVTVDETGDIDKRKDAHKSHLLDCWRYFNWNFLYSFIKQLNR